MAIDTSVGGAHSHTNRIYVIWDENNVERVAHADAVTGTWTTVAVGNGITQDIGGDIKVGADGTVYAIWNDVTNCPPSGGDVTLFRRSTDGGTTWSAQETVFPHSLGSFCTNNLPPAQDSRGVNAFSSLGVDNDSSSPTFGRLYVATCDFPSGTSSGTDLNIYTVYSTDGGTTWPASSKVKVNDDTGTSATQFFPWLSVDPSDGSVNVSWYDTRNFTSTNTKTQIFYAHSANGAVSYEPNVLVTDGGANFTNHVNFCDENSLDNLGANPNQYGDYSGMAALAQLAHPFWTDSRQFYPTSGDTRKEDGATATVTNACTQPPAPAAGNNGPICAGQTLSLTASTVAGATYSWTGPNGFTSSAQNPSIPNATAAAAGTYSVTATVSGCTSAAGTTTATINPLPSATITAPAGVCAGSTGNSASVPSAGTGATYTWTITNGSITSGAGTPAITFSAGGSGTLVLGVTVHTATGCSASGGQSLPITTQPSAPIAGNNGPICTGQTLQLTASTIAGASYSWTGPNGFTSALQNPSIAGATTAASGTYSVTAAVNGCASPAGSTAASVVANVATPGVTAPRCAAVGATGLLASVPANANTYQWSIAGGTITTDPTLPQVSYDVGGPGTLATLSVVETLVGQPCPSDPGIAETQVDFLDVPASSPFHDFICTIARDGITAGCGSGNFCPANVVLRSQMAVFLLRSEHGPAYTPPPAIGIFGDVLAGNPFAPWIERLYGEGITGGCSTNPLLYCPNNSVTRASMAVFLLVAQHGAGYTPPACTGVFSDVACPGAFTNWIEQLYHEAITGGCNTNPLRYCPANSVTRAQMAVFLTATFTLP